MTEKTEIPWICTDPDMQQYGRKLEEHVYEFKEENKAWHITLAPRKWFTDIIDLRKYSYDDIIDYCSPYYSSMEELFGIYGKSSPWIIAECIFEQEQNLNY